MHATRVMPPNDKVETHFHSLIIALYMLSFCGSAAKAAFSTSVALVIRSVTGLVRDCNAVDNMQQILVH